MADRPADLGNEEKLLCSCIAHLSWRCLLYLFKGMRAQGLQKELYRDQIARLNAIIRYSLIEFFNDPQTLCCT